MPRKPPASDEKRQSGPMSSFRCEILMDCKPLCAVRWLLLKNSTQQERKFSTAIAAQRVTVLGSAEAV